MLISRNTEGIHRYRQVGNRVARSLEIVSRIFCRLANDEISLHAYF